MLFSPSSLVWFAVLTAAFPLFAQQADQKVTAKRLVLHVAADYLALHASGTVPPDSTALEYRVKNRGDSPDAAVWTAVSLPASDGRFQFDVPLIAWPWAKLEVRALAGAQLLAMQQVEPKATTLVLLTPERIAALPADQQAAWQAYLSHSALRAEADREVLASECRKLGMASSLPAPEHRAEFSSERKAHPGWFGSAEAQETADIVLSFQTPSGAWSKGIDYVRGPRLPGMQWTNNGGNPWHYCGTLDNRSTTEQIDFLARVHEATTRDDAQSGALRGIEWLLAAQFPNGGWPQVYPVEPGYHEAITLNDGAMQHALELLLAVSRGEAPFTFIAAGLRQRAASAFERGIACLLDCQVRVAGQPTVWCAQHDPLSLAAVAARLKEPPSLSGGESTGMLNFLMRSGPITPATTRAIECGIDWLAAHRVSGLRKTKDANGNIDYVADVASEEIYWARFYDLETGLPIFAGAQDGKIYKTFHEMAQHNQVAYEYFTTKPAELIGREVERWKRRLSEESK